MKNLIFTTLLTLLFSAVVAQINYGDKYYVYFTDKFNSPYSIENPEAFLSQRASSAVSGSIFRLMNMTCLLIHSTSKQ
jgi:hypothetical protein